mmetsp:Transcript_64147/g.126744  ORF Transcript_64147/g.126744 Transcript_64147/m.126744 type:complete len:203 (+) Transcript_64147:818-1426(+)
MVDAQASLLLVHVPRGMLHHGARLVRDPVLPAGEYNQASTSAPLGQGWPPQVHHRHVHQLEVAQKVQRRQVVRNQDPSQLPRRHLLPCDVDTLLPLVHRTRGGQHLPAVDQESVQECHRGAVVWHDQPSLRERWPSCEREGCRPNRRDAGRAILGRLQPLNSAQRGAVGRALRGARDGRAQRGKMAHNGDSGKIHGAGRRPA